jgi:anti-anti-sigma factor
MEYIEPTRPTADRRAALPAWRQLRWLLTLAFFLISAVPLLLTSLVTLGYARERTIEQIMLQLDSVAVLKEDQIRRWLSDSTVTLDYLLTTTVERDLAAALAGQPDPASLSAINDLLAAEVAWVPDGQQRLFSQLIVYNREGRVVAASARSELGKLVARQPFFAASLDSAQTHPPYYAVDSGELTIVTTRPIAGPDGARVGVVAGQLNLDVLAQIMVERTGLSESGETYLVSQENNYLLTPSRFPDYPNNQAYRSEGIDRGLRGEEGRALYDDYRSPAVAVAGVYRWVPELRAALLAEVDLAYADERASRIGWIGGGAAALAVAGSALLGFLVAAWVTRPINTLAEAAGRFARGELDRPAVVSGTGETGLLADAFNAMATQLRATLGGLEQRVAERTRELEAANQAQQRTLEELQATIVERQRLSDTVRDLSSPLLPLMEHVLVMPLIGVIDAERASTIVESMLVAIERESARFVILDITGVPVVDTAVAGLLLRAAQAARLLGAEPVLVGIGPEVAQTLVGLGVSLGDLTTRANLASGVRYALSRQAAR